ncbi:MAG: tellurite resistance protein TehB [Candidatus Saccharibacteria bacterium]|nr:tellurite resistance protein TehB [Candidatus Saccharibacteria bacterium]
MEYPIEVKGQMDCYGQPLAIRAPQPFIKELGEYLAPQSLIADIGSLSGDNGLYLATQGHTVANVDVYYGGLVDGQRKARALGSVANSFIVGSAAALMFGSERCDAVICAHVLQLIDRSIVPVVMDEMQRITRPGGLHAVKVYAGTEHEIAVRPAYTMYQFGELKHYYETLGWQILKHAERYLQPHDDTAGISSYSALIAQKPPAVNTQHKRTYMNANRQLITIEP